MKEMLLSAIVLMTTIDISAFAARCTQNIRSSFISFEAHQAGITAAHERSIKAFFRKSVPIQQLKRVTLLSWYDAPFPRPYETLSFVDRHIAEGRVDHTEEYLRDIIGIPGHLIQTFNMAMPESFVAAALEAKTESNLKVVFSGPDVRISPEELQIIKEKKGPARTLIIAQMLCKKAKGQRE